MKINIAGRVIKRYKVPSKSDKKGFHVVEVWDDDAITCDCIGYGMRKACAHEKLIRRKRVLDAQPTLT